MYENNHIIKNSYAFPYLCQVLVQCKHPAGLAIWSTIFTINFDYIVYTYNKQCEYCGFMYLPMNSHDLLATICRMGGKKAVFEHLEQQGYGIYE